MFHFWVMALKLSKKDHFLQFCSDFSKKPKSVKDMHLNVLITLIQKLVDISNSNIKKDAYSEEI